MDTHTITQLFRKNIGGKCEFSVFNSFFFGDGKIESDIIEITKSGYAVEYEVKVSRSDFLADRRKRKWLIYHQNSNKAPKYFYYLAPKGIIGEKEVPYFAGIIEYENDSFYRTRRPKQISRSKLSFKERYKLLMKLYYKSIPDTFKPEYQKKDSYFF